ncbi:hypothetical protein PFLmoz3_06051 [Pseudomonas fluorescens]|uniref:Uncharacterized protein n=1 Tax=Pseudomonas fluorescens TaxID=294 RepID=A0A120G281_PSEFL|nr:hypothetical protein PFLmoz3_06051 [Pseudomonas fluorescens]
MIAMMICAPAPKPELLYLKLSCSSLTWRQSTSPRCSASFSQASCGSALTITSIV